MPLRKNGQLTPKEQRFVAEYLVDFNASRAAVRAGYSKKTACQIGYENLIKPDIQAAITNSRNSLKSLTDKALMQAHEVESHLDSIIRFNLKDYVNPETDDAKPISELSKEAAGCIAEFSTIETAIGSQRKLKFFNKLDAIKAKMQRLGMLKGDDNESVMVRVVIERSGNSDKKQNEAAWNAEGKGGNDL